MHSRNFKEVYYYSLSWQICIISVLSNCVNYQVKVSMLVGGLGLIKILALVGNSNLGRPCRGSPYICRPVTTSFLLTSASPLDLSAVHNCLVTSLVHMYTRHSPYVRSPRLDYDINKDCYRLPGSISGMK
jgi:hypothetical protein